MLQRYIGVFVRCAVLVVLVFASLAIQASTANGAVLQSNYTTSNPCQAPAQPPAAVCDYSSTTNSVGGASNPYELGSFTPSALGIPASNNLFCGNFDHTLGYYGGNETTYSATPATSSPEIGFLTSTQEQTTNPINADATQVAIWDLLGENPGMPTDSTAANVEQILLGEASSQDGPYNADVLINSSDTQATLSIYDGSGSLFNGGYGATVTITSTSGAVLSQNTYTPATVGNSGTFTVGLPANTHEVSVGYAFLPSTQVVYYQPASPQYQGFYTSGPLSTKSANAIFSKTPANYTLSVQKGGNDAAYYPLAGGVFNVYAGNAGAVGTSYGTLTTNAQGATPPTQSLPAGTYSVVETTPPPGYGIQPFQAITIPTAGEQPGGNTVVSFTGIGLQDQIYPGQLQVVKRDGVNGKPLAGAVFSFAYDPTGASPANQFSFSAPYGTCTTDLSGTCYAPQNYFGGNGVAGAIGPYSLKPGYYEVTETQAPNGYPVPPDSVQTAYVAANYPGAITPSVTVVSFYDWLGSLQVKKSGNDTPYDPITGAVFNATGPSPSTASVGTLTVGANGLSNVLSQLAVGDYTLTETQAPSGYQLSPPQIVAVTNPTNGPYVTVADVNDQIIPAQLSVYKTDASTNKPVGGATFSFAYAPTPTSGFSQSLGSCTTQVTVSNPTGACAPPGNDKQLISIVPLVYKTVGFLPGEYQIEETSPPPGYYLNPQTATQELYLSPGQSSSVSFKDSLYVSASFQKVATGNFNPDQISYAGATVVVTSGSTPGGQSVATCTTNSSGMCTTASTLISGDPYCWIETAAPLGLASGASGCFNATNAQSITPITISDAGEFVDVQVAKFDASDPSLPLSGAIYDLYRLDGGTGPNSPTPPIGATNIPGQTWVARSTTAADGITSFPLQFPNYAYCALEVQAPVNYSLDPHEHCSGVLQGQTSTPAPTITITAYDKPTMVSLSAFKFNSLQPDTGIPGATYDLYVQGSLPPGYSPTTIATTPAPAQEIGDSWYSRQTTSAQGTLSWSVPSGYRWCLKEVTAPINYQLDPALHCTGLISSLTPKQSSTIALPEVLANIVLNAHKFNSLQPDTSIPGATYELLVNGTAPPGNSAASTPSGLPTPPTGESFWAEGTSNQQGNLSFTIPAGYSWCLHEITAPSGYEKDPAYHCTGILTTDSPPSSLEIALPEVPTPIPSITIPPTHTGFYWSSSWWLLIPGGSLLIAVISILLARRRTLCAR